MAFRKVELTEGEAAPPQGKGNFVKFNAIGDIHDGYFVSYIKAENKFGKMENQWTFRDRKGEMFTISANHDLNKRLEKAQLKPGYRVAMKAVRDIPIGPGMNDMRQHEVMVDDDPKGAPPPAPKPKPAADEDIPF